MIKYLAEGDNLNKFVTGVGFISVFGLGLVTGMLIVLDRM